MPGPFRLRVSDDLELRQRQPEDAAELFELIDSNRDHLREWLPWLDSCKSPHDTLTHIEASLRQAEEGRCLEVCIWHKGRIAGVTGFNAIVAANRIGHIGYWLAREHQGRGIMTMCARALVECGFRDLGLNRQVISVAVGNARSRAIPQCLGFTFEGISREAEWLYDHFVDLARYGVTLREWRERSQPSQPAAAGWQLRPMHPSDLPAVLALWQTCEGVGLSPGDEIESLTVMLARNPGLGAVAVDSASAIVGAVLVGHDGRRGYLYHLAVRVDHRGQGIGRALVEASLAGLRAAGIQRCTIMVFDDNEAAACFWKKLGWSAREDLQVLQIVP